MQSYVDRANPLSVAANAMERWYFQPRYDGIAVSEDGLAMKINERGVELVGENERVAGGRRAASGRVNKASQAFCKDFTDKYAMIAEKVRIYAEMRQLFNVAIAAAYIHEQDFYGQASWDMPVLGDEAKFAVQTYTAPEQVETAVNAIWRGNTLDDPTGRWRPRSAATGTEKRESGHRHRGRQQPGQTIGRPVESGRRSMVVGLIRACPLTSC